MLRRMRDYYRILAAQLERNEGEIWAETVLEGPDAGAKKLSLRRDGEDRLLYPAQETVLQSAEGESRIYRERVGTTPKLVICGAGHVSIPIIQIGKMVGFSVTVIEDRPHFADNARRAGADTVICQPFQEALADVEGGRDVWFVIVTRGHRYDTLCLEAVMRKEYAYVGMMGSRRRTAIVKEQLAQSGIDRKLLEEVHTPIGLAIGAQTPEEIAVSIVAEMIQVRNRRGKASGFPEELLNLLTEGERELVLATIVSRKGSAPRDVGAKMAIFRDGSTVGTIGGGCMESEVIQKALHMLRDEEAHFALFVADMTAEAAEEEGMVCGGVAEIMLEKVL